MAILELVLSLSIAATKTADDGETARLSAIAESIALEADAGPLWPGEAGRAATATLLLAIGVHESGLREEVQHCRVRGDNGRSIGLFQLMHRVACAPWSVEDVCGSDRLQASLALSVLHRHQDQCPRCAPRRWIAGYASGDGRRDSQAAREIAQLWVDLSWRHGLVVNPSEARAPVFADGPRTRERRAR